MARPLFFLLLLVLASTAGASLRRAAGLAELDQGQLEPRVKKGNAGRKSRGGGVGPAKAGPSANVTAKDSHPVKPKGCPHGCSGNGDCIDGVCSCFEGFGGKDCSVVHKECPNNCSGLNGRCDYKTGRCTCKPEWNAGSKDCSKSVCPAAAPKAAPGHASASSVLLLCGGHGHCNITSKACTCNQGWSGKACDQPQCPGTKIVTTVGADQKVTKTALQVPCSGHGKCNMTVSDELSGLLEGGSSGKKPAEGAHCICDSGYGGADCSQRICDPRCKATGHGTCVNGECICKPNWRGSNCELPVCPGALQRKKVVGVDKVTPTSHEVLKSSNGTSPKAKVPSSTAPLAGESLAGLSQGRFREGLGAAGGDGDGEMSAAEERADEKEIQSEIDRLASELARSFLETGFTTSATSSSEDSVFSALRVAEEGEAHLLARGAIEHMLSPDPVSRRSVAYEQLHQQEDSSDTEARLDEIVRSLSFLEVSSFSSDSENNKQQKDDHALEALLRRIVTSAGGNTASNGEAEAEESESADESSSEESEEQEADGDADNADSADAKSSSPRFSSAADGESGQQGSSVSVVVSEQQSEAIKAEALLRARAVLEASLGATLDASPLDNKTVTVYCSGHGNCLDSGVCTCALHWTGIGCDMPLCPTNAALFPKPPKGDDVDEDDEAASAAAVNAKKKAQPPACSGHGKCMVTLKPTVVDSTAVCACDDGWSGKDCSTRNCPNGCGGAARGSCDQKSGQCKCRQGYRGKDCSDIICRGDNGHNGGCFGRGNCDSKTGTCSCHRGYYGKACEFLQCPSPAQAMGYRFGMRPDSPFYRMFGGNGTFAAAILNGAQLNQKQVNATLSAATAASASAAKPATTTSSKPAAAAPAKPAAPATASKPKATQPKQQKPRGKGGKAPQHRFAIAEDGVEVDEEGNGIDDRLYDQEEEEELRPFVVDSTSGRQGQQSFLEVEVEADSSADEGAEAVYRRLVDFSLSRPEAFSSLVSSLSFEQPAGAALSLDDASAFLELANTADDGAAASASMDKDSSSKIDSWSSLEEEVSYTLVHDQAAAAAPPPAPGAASSGSSAAGPAYYGYSQPMSKGKKQRTLPYSRPLSRAVMDMIKLFNPQHAAMTSPSSSSGSNGNAAATVPSGIKPSELYVPCGGLEHGVCVSGACYCGQGWTGSACHVPRCPNDCSGRGVCLQGKCVCSVGWGADPAAASKGQQNDCSHRVVLHGHLVPAAAKAVAAKQAAAAAAPAAAPAANAAPAAAPPAASAAKPAAPAAASAPKGKSKNKKQQQQHRFAGRNQEQQQHQLQDGADDSLLSSALQGFESLSAANEGENEIESGPFFPVPHQVLLELQRADDLAREEVLSANEQHSSSSFSVSLTATGDASFGEEEEREQHPLHSFALANGGHAPAVMMIEMDEEADAEAEEDEELELEEEAELEEAEEDEGESFLEVQVSGSDRARHNRRLHEQKPKRNQQQRQAPPGSVAAPAAGSAGTPSATPTLSPGAEPSISPSVSASGNANKNKKKSKKSPNATPTVSASVKPSTSVSPAVTPTASHHPAAASVSVSVSPSVHPTADNIASDGSPHAGHNNIYEERIFDRHNKRIRKWLGKGSKGSKGKGGRAGGTGGAGGKNSTAAGGSGSVGPGGSKVQFVPVLYVPGISPELLVAAAAGNGASGGSASSPQQLVGGQPILAEAVQGLSKRSSVLNPAAPAPPASTQQQQKPRLRRDLSMQLTVPMLSEALLSTDSGNAAALQTASLAAAGEGFDVVCDPGWTGADCSIPVPVCNGIVGTVSKTLAQALARVGGTVNAAGGTSSLLPTVDGCGLYGVCTFKGCACKPGWTGNGCEILTPQFECPVAPHPAVLYNANGTFINPQRAAAFAATSSDKAKGLGKSSFALNAARAGASGNTLSSSESQQRAAAMAAAAQGKPAPAPQQQHPLLQAEDGGEWTEVIEKQLSHAQLAAQQQLAIQQKQQAILAGAAPAFLEVDVDADSEDAGNSKKAALLRRLAGYSSLLQKQGSGELSSLSSIARNADSSEADSHFDSRFRQRLQPDTKAVSSSQEDDAFAVSELKDMTLSALAPEKLSSEAAALLLELAAEEGVESVEGDDSSSYVMSLARAREQTTQTLQQLQASSRDALSSLPRFAAVDVEAGAGVGAGDDAPDPSPSSKPTPTQTPSTSLSSSITATSTRTSSPTSSHTGSFTPSVTETGTPSSTNTQTMTPSFTPSASATPSSTFVPVVMQPGYGTGMVCGGRGQCVPDWIGFLDHLESEPGALESLVGMLADQYDYPGPSSPSPKPTSSVSPSMSETAESTLAPGASRAPRSPHATASPSPGEAQQGPANLPRFRSLLTNGAGDDGNNENNPIPDSLKNGQNVLSFSMSERAIIFGALKQRIREATRGGSGGGGPVGHPSLPGHHTLTSVSTTIKTGYQPYDLSIEQLVLDTIPALTNALQVVAKTSAGNGGGDSWLVQGTTPIMRLFEQAKLKGICRCMEGFRGKACEERYVIKGHGTCDAATGMCSCGPVAKVDNPLFAGQRWDGPSCSLRTCPVGRPASKQVYRAYQLPPRMHSKEDGADKTPLNALLLPPGGNDNTATNYGQGTADGNGLVCSGNGLCDSSEGRCACFAGWQGPDCSRPACSDECNYHGRCVLLPVVVTPPPTPAHASSTGKAGASGDHDDDPQAAFDKLEGKFGGKDHHHLLRRILGLPEPKAKEPKSAAAAAAASGGKAAAKAAPGAAGAAAAGPGGKPNGNKKKQGGAAAPAAAPTAGASPAAGAATGAATNAPAAPAHPAAHHATVAASTVPAPSPSPSQFLPPPKKPFVLKAQCQCDVGWSGATCNIRQCPGTTSPCNGHGRCITATGECSCHKGYYGDDCSVAVGPNTGAFILDNNDVKQLACGEKGCGGPLKGLCNGVKKECMCKEGYTGKHCELKTCPEQCRGRGICDPDTGLCACSPPWSGSSCSVYNPPTQSPAPTPSTTPPAPLPSLPPGGQQLLASGSPVPPAQAAAQQAAVNAAVQSAAQAAASAVQVAQQAVAKQAPQPVAAPAAKAS